MHSYCAVTQPGSWLWLSKMFLLPPRPPPPFGRPPHRLGLPMVMVVCVECMNACLRTSRAGMWCLRHAGALAWRRGPVCCVRVCRRIFTYIHIPLRNHARRPSPPTYIANTNTISIIAIRFHDYGAVTQAGPPARSIFFLVAERRLFMHDSILLYPPPHLHCQHHCNTIARLWVGPSPSLPFYLYNEQKSTRADVDNFITKWRISSFL